MEMDSDNEIDYFMGVATSSFGDMLHDHERNVKFSLALEKAIKKFHAKGEKANVLDIGTGTGLLSMLAVSHGADSVVACEMFEPVAECALKIIKENGFADRIKLIKKQSLKLTVGTNGDLPHKANILVSEVFDTELIGEGAIAVFNHAHSLLLEENCIVIPSVGTIYCQVVDSHSLIKWHRLENWTEGDKVLVNVPLKMKKCPGTPSLFDFQLSQLPQTEFTALTDPLSLFRFDFMRCKKMPLNEYEIFRTKVLNKGKAHAVFTWWDLVMDDEGEIMLSCSPVWHHPDRPKMLPDGNPALDIPWRDHWIQSAYFFQEETEITEDSVTLRAWHDEFSYWFSLCQCGCEQKKDCKCASIKFPNCNCNLHVCASRTRIAAMNCPRRRSTLLKLAQKIVREKKIFIIIGDFTLFGLLLCKLGAQRVYILTDNPLNMSLRLYDDFIEANCCHDKLVVCKNMEMMIDHLKNDVETDHGLKTQICLFAEPYYHTSILPWDNANFTSTISEFFSSTSEFLDKTQVAIYPESFSIKACCVKFDDLGKIDKPVKKCMGFNVEFLDQLLAGAKREMGPLPEAQPLWEYPCKAASDPITLLTWHSKEYDLNQINKMKIVERNDSAMDGIAFWMEYTMLPGLTINTGPAELPQIGHYITWDRCERQGVRFYEEPKNLTCTIKCEPTSKSFISFFIINPE